MDASDEHDFFEQINQEEEYHMGMDETSFQPDEEELPPEEEELEVKGGNRRSVEHSIKSPPQVRSGSATPRMTCNPRRCLF